MELKVYNGEYFERGKVRYLVFCLIILLVVVLSVLWSNTAWWIFVIFIVGGYMFYLTKVNDTTSMIIWKQSFQIWKTVFPWWTLKWFVLEYHTEKKKIQNIVIIDDKNSPRIYSIKDTEENLENFVNELNEYIPMLDNYNQTTFDRIIRKLKL